MRLQLLSDLHFEFHRDGGRAFVDSLNPTGIDVLVLAGDVADAEGLQPALALLCGRFRDASVVYVHGNHEFYVSDRNSVLDITKRAQAEKPNLVWLDSSGAQLHGFNFLGAPLWFPYSTVDERLKHAMNDFSAIKDFESWVYEENARAVAFFEQQLRPGDIVVTHHLPSQRCVAPPVRGTLAQPVLRVRPHRADHRTPAASLVARSLTRIRARSNRRDHRAVQSIRIRGRRTESRVLGSARGGTLR